MSDRERSTWDERYRGPGEPLREPSSFLRSIGEALPSCGRALDVGGGAGRHALWLAARRLATTIVDVSAVGLDIARSRAREAGLSIDTVVADLDRDPLPAGPWDVIVDFHYLQRGLFAAFHATLGEGGYLVFCHPTATNLERHPRPSAAHLLADGEFPALAQLFETVDYFEGWSDEGRHEVRALLRK